MTASRAPQHSDYIDALRGYAVLGVIAVHTQGNVESLGWPLKPLVDAGQFGVQLFFIVSALTLLRSWHARNDGAAAFFVRRLFRIAPMFWLAIILYLCIYRFDPRFFAPDGISWIYVLATALFVHGWHPESFSSVVFGGWSVAVEMTFYLAFPIMARFLTTLPRVASAFVVSMVLAAALHIAEPSLANRLFPDEPKYLVDLFIYFSFFNQLPVFVIGFATYIVSAKQLSEALSRSWLTAAIFGLIFISLLRLPGPQHIIFGIAFGTLTYILGRTPSNIVVNRAVCRVGKVSFSAYLWQAAVLHFINLTLGTIGFGHLTGAISFFAEFGVALAITLSLSELTYRLVERPMIRAGEPIAKAASARRHSIVTAQ